MHTPPMIDYTFSGSSFGPVSPPWSNSDPSSCSDTLSGKADHYPAADVKQASREEWQLNRPIITQLYYKHPLKTLMQKMQSRGFFASPQMFKKRFSIWKLRKNKKREQHARVVREPPKSNHQARRGSCSIEISSQPSQYQRIKRYIREQRPSKDRNQRHRRETKSRTRSLSKPPKDIMSPSSDDHADTNSDFDVGAEEFFPDSNSASMAVLYPQPTDRVNNVVFNVQSYFNFYFTWDNVKQPYGYCKELADVFNIAEGARRAELDHNAPNSLSIRLINDAVFSVEALVRKQPLQLIEEILRRFSRPGWGRTTPHIRGAILKRIARETRRQHQPEHPLVVVTALLQDPSTLNDAASASFKALSDVAYRKLGRGSKDLFAVQQDIADSFSNIEDFDDAEKICQRSLVQAEDIFAPTDDILRNIKRDLGQLRYKQGDPKEAERLWREVYELTVKDKGAPNIGATGILTCEYLALLYKTRGREEDLKLSATYYRLALEGALQKTPRWHFVDVLEYYNSLEEVLVKGGEIDQLMALRTEYAFITDEAMGRALKDSKL